MHLVGAFEDSFDINNNIRQAGANANAIVFKEDGSQITALDIAGITGNEQVC